MASEDSGQRLFLDRARTLEVALLPRLSACSIFKLACTCTQMRDWLFALDSSVLQDTRVHEVAAAHASSLPSVGAAVAALRKAHAAVQNLAAAQAPQRQASEQPWTSEVIEGLLISPDSQHCLVLFHTRGRQGEMKYGAAVHSLASGKRLSMLSQDGRESCSAQFSPCSRRLSVATFTGPFNAMACALAVFETASWQPLSATCSAEAAAALGCHGRDWRCGGVWAPDGQLFMYKGVDKSGGSSGSPGSCDPGVGYIYILDAVQGRLVAAMSRVDVRQASQGGLGQAGWHPGSRGVVSAAHSWQLGACHAAGLQAAGLAVGEVPAPHCVCLDQVLEEGSRFSADGSLLLAQDTGTGHHVVLGCAVRGLDIGFTPVHDFGPLQTLRAVRWHAMPEGCMVLLEDRRGSCRLSTPTGQPVGHEWQQTSIASAHATSPSGTFCIGRQQGGCLNTWAWVLVHCLSGQVAPLARECLQRCYWTPAGNSLVVLHKLCRPYRAGSEPECGPFTTLCYDAAASPAAVPVA